MLAKPSACRLAASADGNSLAMRTLIFCWSSLSPMFTYRTPSRTPSTLLWLSAMTVICASSAVAASLAVSHLNWTDSGLKVPSSLRSAVAVTATTLFTSTLPCSYISLPFCASSSKGLVLMVGRLTPYCCAILSISASAALRSVSSGVGVGLASASSGVGVGVGVGMTCARWRGGRGGLMITGGGGAACAMSIGSRAGSAGAPK
jgi:hypothetical protein